MDFNQLIDSLAHWKHHNEVGSFAWLRVADYFTLKVSDNLPRDVKTKSDSLHVKLFWCIDKAKKLKKILLVLLFDSNSIVLNLHFNQLLFLWVLDDFAQSLIADCKIFSLTNKFAADGDGTASGREFYGIWEEIQQNLLQTLLIKTNYVIVSIVFILIG